MQSIGVEPEGCRAERPVATRPKAPRSSRESGPVCVRGSLSLYATCQVPERQAWGLTGMDKEKDMKRIIAQQSMVILALAALALAAGTVWGDSPHFIGTPT